jgi:sterol desaturase/sphingolipid hydroxylase (fatty acid hydroxylase superfamily)
MATASACTILYEWVHFLTHTDYKPKGSYYRRIWKLHRWHHYKNEHYWFSFTVPWIDAWLGTGPSPQDVPRSPTARDLRPSPSEEASAEQV